MSAGGCCQGRLPERHAVKDGGSGLSGTALPCRSAKALFFSSRLISSQLRLTSSAPETVTSPNTLRMPPD